MTSQLRGNTSREASIEQGDDPSFGLDLPYSKEAEKRTAAFIDQHVQKDNPLWKHKKQAGQETTTTRPTGTNVADVATPHNEADDVEAVGSEIEDVSDVKAETVYPASFCALALLRSRRHKSNWAWQLASLKEWALQAVSVFWSSVW